MSAISDVVQAPVYLELCGEKYKLGLIDFYFQAWAHAEFATEAEPNGMKALEESFRNCLQPGIEVNFLPIVQTIWHLIEDKTNFPNVKDFINSFSNQVQILEACLPALVDVFNASYPEFTEAEKASVEKKKEFDYFETFDRLAAAYGWTVDQIGKLTERQTEGFLRQIHNTGIDSRQWEASIHGVKLDKVPPKLQDRNRKTEKNAELYDGQKERTNKIFDFLKSDEATEIFSTMQNRKKTNG